MGGGGGTDYSAVQAKQDAQKQSARDNLNALFGIAPTGGAPAATGVTPGSAVGPRGVLTGINAGKLADDAAATSAYDQNTATAATNKTARDALYDTVRSDAYTAGKTALDDTRTSAARNNKFALFAQGLNGGSQDVDESALLGRTYDQGLLDLGAKADLAKTGLQSSDESARLGLLQSIDNGMDQGSAMSSALEQMKNGVNLAEASAEGTNLGDLFGGAGLLYTKSNAARGGQDGSAYFNQLLQGARLSGGSGNGGIVTRTGG